MSRVTVIIILIGQRWTVVIFVIVFVVGQRWTVFIVIFIIVIVVTAAARGTDIIGSTVERWKNEDSRVAGPVQSGFSTGGNGAVVETNSGRGLQFQFPVTRGGTCDGISSTGLCTLDTNCVGRSRWPPNSSVADVWRVNSNLMCSTIGIRAEQRCTPPPPPACRRGLQCQCPVTRGGTCDGISGTGPCTIDTNRVGR
jgi:hypothetical protein